MAAVADNLLGVYMPSEKLISIVTPMHNHRKYIPRTVEAILNQTYQNWEWIICDDCSKDGSYEYMLDVAKYEPRMKVLHNEVNQKIVITTQRCMDAAKGEYMYILDSDDYCAPEYLTRMASILDKDPNVAVAFSRCYTMDKEDGYWGAWPTKPNFKHSGVKEFWHQLLSYSMKGTTTLYRMNHAKEIGGWQAHPLIRMHDKYFDLRMLLCGDVAYIDEPLGYYRIHDTNHSSDKDEQIIPAVAEEVFGMVDDLMARVPENPYYKVEDLRKEANAQYVGYISHLICLAESKGKTEYAQELMDMLAKRGYKRTDPIEGPKMEKAINIVRPMIKKMTYKKLPPLQERFAAA